MGKIDVTAVLGYLNDRLFGKELFIWFTVCELFINICVFFFLLVLRVGCWI